VPGALVLGLVRSRGDPLLGPSRAAAPGVPGLPDAVTREAYSHEVSPAGFWPGGSGTDEPTFYSYVYPAPEGFAKARVEPEAARYDESLGEFLLSYGAVRRATILRRC